MSKAFIKFFNLLSYIFKYKKILVSRWLRSFTESPTTTIKSLKPLNLEEAIFCIMELANRNPELKRTLDSFNSPTEFATANHHGLGQAIRNDWKLWVSNSELFKDLKERFGLFHADDMSSLILSVSFQRYKGSPETPNLFAWGSIFYWKDMKERGEWDGQALGAKVDLSIPSKVRFEVAKEKKSLQL